MSVEKNPISFSFYLSFKTRILLIAESINSMSPPSPSLENPTNLKRVNNIVEIVGLIEKSAKSNKASQTELWALLTPAVDAISQLCGDQPADSSEAPVEAPTPSPAPTHKPSRWADIHDLAENASLLDLTTAMAVFLNRIDEYLHSKEPRK